MGPCRGGIVILEISTIRMLRDDVTVSGESDGQISVALNVLAAPL
jgi:hypothetical protein